MREAVWEYGPEAARYASAIPSGIPAIVADVWEPQQAAHALAMAAERKKTGETFFTAVLLDEPRAVVATRFAHVLLQQFPGLDDRRLVFDQLASNLLTINNQAQAAIPAYDSPVAETLRDLMQMGDALLCRSWRERDRLARIFGAYRPVAATLPGACTFPEMPASRVRDAIVIWAPHVSASAAAIAAFALEELRFPAYLVCADGAQLPLRTKSVRIEEAPEVLSRALLLIDASPSDPAAAIAWAQRGGRVVAASSTGADEYLHGVALFDPWNWRSVFRAAISGISASPPRVRRTVGREELESALQAAAPPRIEREPLVSIIVPTRNRPVTLAVALESLTKQIYNNLEIVVVNDGGDPIDEIVSRFPAARLIDRGRVGIIAANRLGLAEAQGEYIGYLADDDIYYPDQIPRLVYALETTGADVAHSNNVIRFVEHARAHEYKPVGFKVVWDRPVDPTEMLVASSVAGQSFLYRRAAYDRYGDVIDGVDAQLDYEFSLRWNLGADFVHVDVVTNEWLYRQDPEQYNVSQAANMARDLETVFGIFPTDRPAVQRKRESHLAMLRAQRPGESFWSPAIRLTPEVQDELPLFVLRTGGP